MARKIRLNDEVIVISGKYKGKRGRVVHILSSGHAIVSGINIVKKHQRSIPSANKPGKIFEKESKIDISNLAIFNIITGKPDRIGFRIQNNQKIRFFKSDKRFLE